MAFHERHMLTMSCEFMTLERKPMVWHQTGSIEDGIHLEDSGVLDMALGRIVLEAALRDHIC